jgi:4-diphosphocytidyl-2-C-methyl-D-erythritol kinase
VAGCAPLAKWQRSWPAPAKLNLFLHVIGRRPDGYHLLQTVFRLIDCYDWLTFSPRDDGDIRRGRPVPHVPEEGDLALRAARLLQQETGCPTGATIDLDKRIPVGGGLGGGSSDAATTLIALNELWGTNLSRGQLSELAIRLGADVPFFLLGRNAFGEGVGEVLAALDLEPAWYVIVTPQVEVSTREIFGAPKLTRNTKPLNMAAFFAGVGRNDLEPVVRERFPEVARALDWLQRYGTARMSGSGSSVFAAFATELDARTIASRVPGEWRGMVVRGLDRHPLASE